MKKTCQGLASFTEYGHVFGLNSPLRSDSSTCRFLKIKEPQAIYFTRSLSFRHGREQLQAAGVAACSQSTRKPGSQPPPQFQGTGPQAASAPPAHHHRGHRFGFAPTGGNKAVFSLKKSLVFGYTRFFDVSLSTKERPELMWGQKGSSHPGKCRDRCGVPPPSPFLLLLLQLLPSQVRGGSLVPSPPPDSATP